MIEIEDDFLARAVRAAVRQPSVIDALCSNLERELIGSLRHDLAGSAEYIPRMARAQRQARADRIKQAFTGHNIQALARAEGLSESRVRKILFPAKRKA